MQTRSESWGPQALIVERRLRSSNGSECIQFSPSLVARRTGNRLMEPDWSSQAASGEIPQPVVDLDLGKVRHAEAGEDVDDLRPVP